MPATARAQRVPNLPQAYPRQRFCGLITAPNSMFELSEDVEAASNKRQYHQMREKGKTEAPSVLESAAATMATASPGIGYGCRKRGPWAYKRV